MTRRQFARLSLGSMAFAGLACSGIEKNTRAGVMPSSSAYGPLSSDAKGLLDLPTGFSYQVISEFGEKMSDGMRVPDRADGMGCIPLSGSLVALIRNQELRPEHRVDYGPVENAIVPPEKVFDSIDGAPLPGGTTTLIYDVKKHQRVDEYLSLIGTIRNCAGGVTPWGTWLSCEEAVQTPADGVTKFHGWVFEVDPKEKGIADPIPLKAMGRFNHEAACIDPETGVVYLTEDRDDSLLYRFIPNEQGNLKAGGKLQALCVRGVPKMDTRNWSAKLMAKHTEYDTYWVDILNPESPNDDLRYQGIKKGAAIFARGEGIHWGDGELYFCCTSGGGRKLGQVMRYVPSSVNQNTERSSAGRLSLFVESENEALYNFGDNLTVAPNGHLIVCEDQYMEVVENHLRGVTPEGKIYTFAKLRTQTELAGACFSPDGKTLFVNVYSPAKTLAITGPWEAFVSDIQG